MKSGEAKTLYWFDHGMHFMASAEIRWPWPKLIWRFLIQKLCSNTRLKHIVFA